MYNIIDSLIINIEYRQQIQYLQLNMYKIFIEISQNRKKNYDFDQDYFYILINLIFKLYRNNIFVT